MKAVQRRRPAELVASPAHVEGFKAIAHIARLRIFFFLVSLRKEAATGDIQEALSIPGPTLSHHLDILKRAGLIASRRESRFIYCSVNYGFVSDLVRLLSACC
jgi:ArsR family transcriptional regulator, arsenate/arsenite/antimonite-responsive transcriptional repressor